MPPPPGPPSGRQAGSGVTMVYLRCVGGKMGSPQALAPKLRPLGLDPRKIASDIAEVTREWAGLKITCKLTVRDGKARIDVVPSAATRLTKALQKAGPASATPTPTQAPVNLPQTDPPPPASPAAASPVESAPVGQSSAASPSASSVGFWSAPTASAASSPAPSASSATSGHWSLTPAPPSAQSGAGEASTIPLGGRRPKANLRLEEVVEIARQMRPRSMAKALEGTTKEILGTSHGLRCTVNGQHPQEIIEKIRSGEITIPPE